MATKEKDLSGTLLASSMPPTTAKRDDAGKPGPSEFSSISDWRAHLKTGERKILPSGLVVSLRRVSLLDLAREGVLPDSLSPLIEKLISTGRFEINLSEVGEFIHIADLIARRCIIDPPIVDGIGDDEHIGLDEIPTDDKMAVFAWANEGGQELRPFRS